MGCCHHYRSGSEGADSVFEVLERHLEQLNEEMERLRERQRTIAKLLGDARALLGNRSLNKEDWVRLLASGGMSPEGMDRWHAEFERGFPDAHQDFLQSLGIPAEEVALIRAHSARASKG